MKNKMFVAHDINFICRNVNDFIIAYYINKTKYDDYFQNVLVKNKKH